MNMDYLKQIRTLLEHVEQNMVPVIEKVAEACADTIANDGLLYFFGTGHSHMICEEPFYRAGGLANISPLLKNSLMLHEGAAASSMYERLPGMGTTVIESSDLKAGDVIFLISNSGRNAACIDAAIAAKAKGAVTVAITSLNHSRSVSSRHPSGKKLYELCDFVLDNGGVYGDACVHLDGMEEGAMISPTSSVIDITMLNMTMTATAEKLLERGIYPTVFTSANAEGGDDKNAEIIEEFKKRVPIL